MTLCGTLLVSVFGKRSGVLCNGLLGVLCNVLRNVLQNAEGSWWGCHFDLQPFWFLFCRVSEQTKVKRNVSLDGAVSIDWPFRLVLFRLVSLPPRVAAVFIYLFSALSL